MAWTYLTFSISNALMYAMQSVETAHIGMMMSISTIILNFTLNQFLVFGHFGAPELGIVGSAIATLISRSIELIIVLVYILFIDKKLRMRLIELLRFDFTYAHDYIRIATPPTISGALWGVAQGAQTAVLGHIGASVIAANSIAVIIFQVFAVVGMSCANSSSVITAKTIGEGRLDMIRSYAKTLQGIFVILGVVSGLALFLCKDAIVGFYNISDETAVLAIDFITILAVTTVGTCYEYPVESGIVAGGGTTKYPAIVDNLFMWLFTIPFSALSAFVFCFPPQVTFMFLKADQILKCIPNFIKVNRFHWVRILTREEEDTSKT